MTLETAEKVSGIAADLATITAIVFGGLWTYYHFVRGRVFRARLEPHIACSVIHAGPSDYVLVTVELKNVGLSRVKLSHHGMGFRLHRFTVTRASGCHEVLMDKLRTVRVFEGHDWVEPGETVIDKCVLGVPPDGDAGYCAELRVVAEKIQWKARDIVVLSGGEYVEAASKSNGLRADSRE